ncbi:DNA sulfur modification protein DndB [Photorhabdus temperata]|uniref:DNA sulfur modification protein DndB n=3 Tax=Photorhabdus TaxID=29487 RepID=A0A7X5QIK5_9GAMM|nr:MULTISPECIES: DNA sulfur modification protein DndB [Photorhabdus]ETS32566.1 DNA sulfur modification protein DndB [Photorhabdus khanii NC19]MQL50672.1 DNA sulfur modification protein DndB [Photorhabdus khanii]NHB95035.1 DNA sulfur modification protein DndB [Photorhabdus stackebrandtii]OHV52028.1 DNA sulfur modification protein DndB [Photorhabdus temperata]
MTNIDVDYCYSFPALRGIQAGKPFYVAMCPMRVIPKIFSFDENEVPPELRAQRSLNKARIPEMARYLIENPKDYIFSALTASIAIDVRFDEFSDSNNLGTLRVPMEAQILINDGQHRRKAIEDALEQMPELGQDNIPVLFFVDEGLKRSQQMFADLNKYAIRPSPSLSALYDHRDISSNLARYLAMSVEPFAGLTELEKSSISKLSNKLFTLSSIKQATRALLGKDPKEGDLEENTHIATLYWQAVYHVMPDWQLAAKKEVSPAQLRQDHVHAHGIGLQALGLLGRSLLAEHPEHWQQKIAELKAFDWRKSNPELSKRAMQHGKLSKTSAAIQLTCNALKHALSLPLTPEEQELEAQMVIS